MIEVFKETVIYIVCPAYDATGGTELLHQLCFKLRHRGYPAKMFYYNVRNLHPVNERFKQYEVEFVESVVDDPSSVLIVPEVYTDFLFQFTKIRKVIWWLSVDNYFKSRKRFLKIFPSKYENIQLLQKDAGVNYNLVQSEYARNFLKQKGIHSMFLSDYLNKTYLNEARGINFENRSDVVLYNPKKGIEFTKKLISLAPDIHWVPLVNLTVEQVAQLLRTSKIYIDFGHHPGKDRFPREAAIMGCIVITGTRGAAAFSEDLPIPEKYKFSEKSPKKIVEQIRESLKTYLQLTSDFTAYRNFIFTEENKFDAELLEVFVKK